MMKILLMDEKDGISLNIDMKKLETKKRTLIKKTVLFWESIQYLSNIWKAFK